MSARPRTRSNVKSHSVEPSEYNDLNGLEFCPCENTCKKETNQLWICCDKCKQWWHTYCLGITSTEYAKLKISYYMCPKCAIQKIRTNSTVIGKISETLQEKIDTKPEKQEKLIESSRVSAVSCSKSGTFTTGEQTVPSENHELPYAPTKDNIVILDNVTLTKELRNSAKLKREIKKHKPEIKISQVYPLAGGGVALHCKDNPSTELALSDWPKAALNSTEHPKPHRIRSLQESQTVVVKSVHTRYTELELLQDLKNKYPSVSAVHRLYNKKTDTPFPIIKVELSRAEAASVLSSHIVVLGQILACETCRSVKVVRCFECQRFGHTADRCLFPVRCVNCSGCHKHQCTLPARCANCDGEHGSDSNKCPAYLGIKYKLEARKIANC